MPKLVKQNLVNTVFVKQLRAFGATALILAATAALCWLVGRRFGPLWGAAVLLAGGAMAYLSHRQAAILGAGARGERETLGLLKTLPGDYVIFPDLTLQNGRHQSQLDYLILTPCGPVVLECKNVSGIISGDASAQNLSQTKVRGGTPYEQKTMYNPLRQVEGHARTLRGLLKSGGLELPVRTAVYFSNPHATLRLGGRGQNLFAVSQSDALLDFLTKRPEKPLPKGWEKKVTTLVKRGGR